MRRLTISKIWVMFYNTPCKQIVYDSNAYYILQVQTKQFIAFDELLADVSVLEKAIHLHLSIKVQPPTCTHPVFVEVSDYYFYT